ncbi:MAG: M1 family metallopeptidase [bacterium]|jgi:aminopeptidase N
MFYRSLINASRILFFFIVIQSNAQLTTQAVSYSRADTLRGSLLPERIWWDVLHYNIEIEPNYKEKTIKGKVALRFKAVDSGNVMQIDLQSPMNITSAMLGNQPLTFRRDGNVFYMQLVKTLPKGSTDTLFMLFEGKVRQAIQPPWDGGWIFSQDKLGRPWMSVACQGLGASVWYPCKDHQSDEPDQGAKISITVPDTLVAVANGKLNEKQTYQPGTTTYSWKVNNPINNYNIVPYIGKYVNIEEVYQGEKGDLECSYWVIDYNIEKARQQFKQVPDMLKAFEHWFGPYPFYSDGYKLVESPHLGMEHQSAIAYGNGYQNGYLGKDLSGTGWGKKWDFIIIHESGHEWFGNNITTKDIADMWVHEGFTNYSEALFTEYQYGKIAGEAYVQGLRKLIKNDRPIIGNYDVNEEGSGDMYFKAANLIHYIRQLCESDDQFRNSLRQMSERFSLKTTNSAEIEHFWSTQTGIDLKPLFDQYLRTTQVPTLEVKRMKGKIMYRWKDCISSFNLPINVYVNGIKQLITPTVAWQKLNNRNPLKEFKPDGNFYVGYAEEL